jgi:hypothetical protein
MNSGMRLIRNSIIYVERSLIGIRRLAICCYYLFPRNFAGCLTNVSAVILKWSTYFVIPDCDVEFFIHCEE